MSAIIALPDNWESLLQRADDLGLDGMRLLALKLAIARGEITESCDHTADPEIWSWYRDLQRA